MREMIKSFCKACRKPIYEWQKSIAGMHEGCYNHRLNNPAQRHRARAELTVYESNRMRS